MTGADLQWQEYEIPVGSLDESVDERLLPPGQLVQAINCEFTSERGNLKKRPGCVLVSEPPVDQGDADDLPLSRLVPHTQKNQLLAVDLTGTNEAIPALYALLDAAVVGDQGQKPRRVGSATNALPRRYPLANDLQSDIVADGVFVETATNFAYMVYGTVSLQTGNMGVKVVQVVKEGDAWEPGNTVIDTEISYSRTGGDAYFVRAAAVLDNYVLLTWQYDAGTIRGLVVDCGSTLPTIGTLTSIVTDGVPGQLVYHDTAGDTTSTGSQPNWVLTYVKQTAGTQLRVMSLDGSLAQTWNVSPSSEPSDALSIMEKSGRTWVNWYEANVELPDTGVWRYCQIDTADGSIDLSAQTWCNQAAISANAYIEAPGRISGIAPTDSSTAVMLFHSQNYGVNNGSITYPAFTPLTRWRRGASNGGLGGLRQKRGVRIRSKPWADEHEGWYCAWTDVQSVERYDDITVSLGPHYNRIPRYVFTATLMRFAEVEALEADLATAILLTTAGEGKTMASPWKARPEEPTTYDMEDWLAPPSSVSHAPLTVGEDNGIRKLGRRCALNFRYVPLEDKNAPWDIAVRFDETDDNPRGYGRYTSKRFGGATYMAGGMLTEWDGDRHHENNFIKAPDIYVDNNNTATPVDWPASYAPFGDTYIYAQAVYETVLQNGERVRSATSAVFPIYLNNDGVSGQPDNDLLFIYLEPLTVSMRTYGGLANKEYDTPRTLVTLYLSSEPDGQVLHRAFEFQDSNWDAFVCDPDALEPIKFTLVTGGVLSPPYDNWDTSFVEIPELARNEVIYNDSGELDNDPVFGGCSCIEVHKDRLWVGGGDDPEVLWYSKERVDGRPAEFALGQQIRIPGDAVVGLASLDDALIVFCEHSVFAILLDGPNATGDPGSGFFQVTPISTTTGCNSAASIAKIPGGVLFRGEGGMYLLNRGRTIEYASQVIDQINEAKTPIASAIVPEFMQARIILQPDDFSDVLVYDWDVGKWATWRYALPANVVDQAYLGPRIYILTADGRCYREDAFTFADGGFAYRQRARWGWLSFGRVQGYKRIRKLSKLLNTHTFGDYSSDPDNFPYGLKLTMDFNYDESGTFSAERLWSSYELGQILPQDGIAWLRTHIPYQKQPSIRVTLDEAEPVLLLLGSNTSATVNTTGANVLKIKIQASSGFSTFTVTADAAAAKSAILTEIQAAIVAAGWDEYLRAYLTGNKLALEIIKKESDTGLGSYLAVDSVANGSTLNTPLGYNVAGEVGTAAVAPASQSGFVVESLAFEVGHARGSRRLPAAQSR